MKKINAIFLFFMMILCSSGFYLAFYISLHTIKHTQRQIILSSDLKDKYIFEFSFSKNGLKNNHEDFSFVEKHEIKYKGKMYDIISQQSTPDSIFIKCIADEQEDYTLALAENEIIKKLNARNQKNLSDLKLRLGVYTFNSENLVLNFSFVKVAPQSFFVQEKLLSPFINTPSLPPWLLHSNPGIFLF